MIHSAETIKCIRTLLVHSGVPKGEVLEEMVDHYLSDIEWQVELKTPLQIAIQNTLRKIEGTDFSHLRQKKKSRLPLSITAIVLLALVFYFHQSHPSANREALTENMQEIRLEGAFLEKGAAPDGWPLQGTATQVTSNFGMRRHPIQKSIKLHKGIDVKAEPGTPVLATGKGVIMETGFSNKAGKYIILKHNDRFSSRYNHLSIIHVKENDLIPKGSIIGEVGNTGASMAPHLHYEIIDNGAHIDPLEHIKT